jgi:hypothetical protein
MSKSVATLESHSDSTIARAKRSRKPRVKSVRGAELVPLAPSSVQSGAFPTKPLLVGIGIGAALALGAVALGARPQKASYFGSRPPSLAGALSRTAALVLARFVARKALSAAAHQGARKLASAWPL